MNKLFAIIIILIPLLGTACRKPVKMYERLFYSDLIVKTKIVNHTQSNYTLQIIDIYRDVKTGIKVGDYIKIKKQMNVETSADIVYNETIVNRKTGLAFLTKSEQDWRVNKFSTFTNEKATLRFDNHMCNVTETGENLKAQIKEYFNEFHLDADGKVVGKKTEKEVLRSNLGQLALMQYTRIYLFTLDPKVREKLDCEMEEMIMPED